MAGLDNLLLTQSLKPLEKYYSQPDMEEVALNRPGEVWIKKWKGQWEAHPDPDMTYDYVMSVCRLMANITEQSFDKDVLPILAATLPGGHRFQAVMGPNVRYELTDTQGLAICIRCFHHDKKIGLEDFGLKSHAALTTEKDEHPFRQKFSEFAYEDLVAAVDKGAAVLISGATSTGKTTFLNALVQYIPEDRRIITVEDTREVLVPHHNRVHFVVSRTAATNKVDWAHILDSCVRLTPDVLICGEISITNAKSIYRLMTTGHANFMATIHADTPEMALRAFWQNLTQNDPQLDAGAAIEILSRSFGRIVQIDRSSGQRVITNVDVPGVLQEAVKEEGVNVHQVKAPDAPAAKQPQENDQKKTMNPKTNSKKLQVNLKQALNAKKAEKKGTNPPPPKDKKQGLRALIDKHKTSRPSSPSGK